MNKTSRKPVAWGRIGWVVGLGVAALVGVAFLLQSQRSSPKRDWRELGATPAYDDRGELIGLDFHAGVDPLMGLIEARKHLRLQSLDLSGASVRDDDLMHVAAMDQLSDLDLSDTQIGDAGVRHLAGLSLTRLILRRCPVTDAGLDSIGRIQFLEELSLSGAPITSAGIAQLKPLRQLTRLYLNDTAVDDSGLPDLAQLSSLEGLALRDTKVSDVQIGVLGQLPRLRILHLGGVNVSDMSLNQMVNWPALEGVCVERTACTEEAAHALRRDSPTVIQVIW